jgi:hypothetical protein
MFLEVNLKWEMENWKFYLGKARFGSYINTVRYFSCKWLLGLLFNTESTTAMKWFQELCKIKIMEETRLYLCHSRNVVIWPNTRSRNYFKILEKIVVENATLNKRWKNGVFEEKDFCCWTRSNGKLKQRKKYDKEWRLLGCAAVWV